MEYEECERCGKDEPEDYIQIVDIDGEWQVCEACFDWLCNKVKHYDWKERYTEEQHERAKELLSERDEVQCVISSYEDGQIIVHTPYVSSDVVADFCRHFQFEIRSFGPIWEETGGGWPCLDKHGSTFQILLEYNHHRPMPVPTGAIFETLYIDELTEADKQF